MTKSPYNSRCRVSTATLPIKATSSTMTPSQRRITVDYNAASNASMITSTLGSPC